MKPVQVNFINGLILAVVGLYGYFGVAGADGNASPTALIPTAFGVLLIILGFFWEKAPKIVSHVVVVLTLVLLVMVTNRFLKVDAWDSKKYLFLAALISNAVALVVFIRSFVAARMTK